MAGRAVTCGTIVTDGGLLLLGHASGSPRWDVPKGMAEPGERHQDAARRELEEETGLTAPETGFVPLGQFAYLPAKDIALFLWPVPAMPDPASLVCRSIVPRTGRPEFDRFACVPWSVAWTMVGTSLKRVLVPLVATISERVGGAVTPPA